MKNTVHKSAALGMVALFAMNAHAAQPGAGEHTGNNKAGDRPLSSRTLPVADGEVEDIDMEGKYVILKHGPIRNLNMSAMTMAFAVKNTAMLAGLKVGDRVKFTAENVGDVATITSINIQNEQEGFR